jgi:hypothetical protein
MPGRDPLAAMRKPFLLTIIFAATFALFAQTQPQSPVRLVDGASASAIDGAGGAVAKDPVFDGTMWWNYVKILAADNMEGRETGSSGLHKAQEYVVEQLKRAGLEPVGSKSFYQPIRFESRQIVENESSLVLVHNGRWNR